MFKRGILMLTAVLIPVIGYVHDTLDWWNWFLCGMWLLFTLVDYYIDKVFQCET